MTTEPISTEKPTDLPGQRIIEQPTGQPADRRSILAKLDSGEFRSVNNFAGDKMDVWRMTSKATGPDCKSYQDGHECLIDLQYYYCHRVEMVSTRDGEIIEPVRVVLIDKSGECWGFVSDFLARELDTLIEMWGNGPWTEPLKIRVTKAKSRKGFSFYTIQPA